MVIPSLIVTATLFIFTSNALHTPTDKSDILMTLSSTRSQELKTSLINRLIENGFKTDDTGAIISDGLEYPLYLSILNSTTVMCQFGYAIFSYGNDVDSKRNSIKTAKDICEFYHALKTGKAQALHCVNIPELRLLYRNSTNGRWVAVTHHVTMEYNDLYFNGGEMILGEINKMNLFSRIIVNDIRSNIDCRWTKETLVPKKWWTH